MSVGFQACVEPDLVSKVMLVPKDNTLKEGRVIHAEVETVIPRGAQGNKKPLVKLRARQEPVPCDIVVLATGTEYSFPGRVPWWTGGHGRLPEDVRYHFQHDQRVQIDHEMGGGPVGCELAAMIAEAFPDIKTRLIHGGKKRLCSSVRGPVMLESTKGGRASGHSKRSTDAINGFLKQKRLIGSTGT